MLSGRMLFVTDYGANYCAINTYAVPDDPSDHAHNDSVQSYRATDKTYCRADFMALLTYPATYTAVWDVPEWRGLLCLPVLHGWVPL